MIPEGGAARRRPTSRCPSRSTSCSPTSTRDGARGPPAADRQLGATCSSAAAPTCSALLGKARRSLPRARAASSTTSSSNQRGAADAGAARPAGVVDAVDRSTPDLRALLDGAAQTFDAIAAEADNLKIALDALPARAAPDAQHARPRRRHAARGGRADRPARARRRRELRRTAAPLTRDAGVAARGRRRGARRLLARHRHALRTPARVCLPPARRLAATARRSASRRTNELDCVRPYAPELAAARRDVGRLDLAGRRARPLRCARTSRTSCRRSYNSCRSRRRRRAKIFPGLEYGFPRPPGAARRPAVVPAAVRRRPGRRSTRPRTRRRRPRQRR